MIFVMSKRARNPGFSRSSGRILSLHEIWHWIWQLNLTYEVSHLAWHNCRDLTKLAKEMGRAERKFHRYRVPSTKEAFLAARKTFYGAIAVAKEEDWLKFKSTLERSNVYDVLNRLRRRPRAVFPSLVDTGTGEAVVDHVGRGRLLAETWFGAAAEEMEAEDGGEGGSETGVKAGGSEDWGQNWSAEDKDEDGGGTKRMWVELGMKGKMEERRRRQGRGRRGKKNNKNQETTKQRHRIKTKTETITQTKIKPQA
ncbi:hypothetical protein B0H13DRAFT_1907557 [Mycena leptocephala]|nr:hypothetical protein B0H13DRAFT_1907557 [Mycena leptocephala]